MTGRITDFSIRPFVDADFDGVTILWRDSWASTGLAVADLEIFRERLPQDIARGWEIHVVETASVLAAFLALHGEKLEQIFVAPPFQRPGLGKALLEFVRAARPAGFWLTTATDNLGAITFYEREGLRRGPVTLHPGRGHEIVRYDWKPVAL